MHYTEVTEHTISEVTTEETNKILEAVEGTLNPNLKQLEVEEHHTKAKAPTGAQHKYKEEETTEATITEVPRIPKMAVEAKTLQNQTGTNADIAKSQDTW